MISLPVAYLRELGDTGGGGKPGVLGDKLQVRNKPADDNLLGVDALVQRIHGLVVLHVDHDLVVGLVVRHREAVADLNLRDRGVAEVNFALQPRQPRPPYPPNHPSQPLPTLPTPQTHTWLPTTLPSSVPMTRFWFSLRREKWSTIPK